MFDGRIIGGITVFVAVAKAGSYARAADQVGLSRSGVGKAIARLEERTGMRLFDRNSRALKLTDQGRGFLEEVAPLMERLGAIATPDSLAEARPPRSQWRNVWDQFKTHRGAVWGMGFFIFVVLAVTLGPYVWTIDAQYIDIRARNQGPSLAHPMGTDQLGRDTLARVLEGGQVSMAVGIAAMAHRVIHFREGQIAREEYNTHPVAPAEISW